jgi:hypothetical protein
MCKKERRRRGLLQIEATYKSEITLVYMDFAVLNLKLDLNEVFCADSRNVIIFITYHFLVI